MKPTTLPILLAAAALFACARFHSEKSPPEREARARDVDVEHYRIAVTPDFASRRIEGEVAVRFRPIVEDLRRLVLDCADLDVYRVEEKGSGALSHEADGRLLVVDLGRPRAPSESVTVIVRYGGAPVRGIYFRTGVGSRGEPTPQLFTQGEPEDTRYWVPCVDDPGDRATSETIVTVPESLVTLAAGALVAQTPARGLRTDHWRMEKDHVPYLLTLVVGDFAIVEDRWRDVPLLYVVEPGDVSLVEPAFGRTPEILEFFSEWTGVPYPWPKYAQVCVRDFLWGGMENVSATTLHRRVLHPAELEREASSVSLVAHEAAHQWFGDLLTCATWADLWLNEGFASYFDLLFLEHAEGRDEFRYGMLQAQEEYAAVCRGEGRHPIVWSRYEDPEEMFDEHIYPGGAARLDLLRFVLGDAEFRRAIGAWTREGRLRCVTSGDFLRSLEHSTGKRLREFFEDWVWGAGYPEFRVRERYEAAASALVLTVEQTQEPVAGTPGAFRVPVEVLVEDEGGNRSVHRFDLRSRRERLVISVDARPRLVRFDVASRIPKSLDHEKSLDAWLHQVARDPDVAGRVEAIEELARIAGAPAEPLDAPESPWERPGAQPYVPGSATPTGPEAARALDALARAGTADVFRGVKERAAEALGRLGGTAAREALRVLAETEDPRVRMVVAQALGRFSGDGEAETILRRLLEADSSPYVAGAAARSIGTVGREGAFDRLLPHLDRSSHAEVLRAGVLEGFADLDEPRGFREAARFVSPSSDEALRPRAIAVLGRLGRRDPEALAVLEGILRGDDYNARLAAAEALGEAENRIALAILRARLDGEPDGRIRAAIDDSIWRVEDRLGEATPASGSALLFVPWDRLAPGRALRIRAGAGS